MLQRDANAQGLHAKVLADRVAQRLEAIAVGHQCRLIAWERLSLSDEVSKVPQPLERLIRSPHHRLWGNKDDLLAGMGDASGAERRPSGHLPGCVCSVLTKGDRPHCVVSLAQRGQVGDVGLSACLLPPLRLLPGAT
jgi:hypothetical protein